MSIAHENADRLFDFDGRQTEWINRNSIYRRKRQGEPYNYDQVTELEEANVEEVGINFFKPIIDTIVSEIYADKSGIATVPVGDSDKKLAYILQAMLDGCLHDSKWKPNFGVILGDTYGEGLGVARVDRADNIFGCKVEYVDYQNLRFPAGADMFWNDLDELIYFTKMTVRQAIVRTGEAYHPSMESVQRIANNPKDLYTKFYSDSRFGLRQSPDSIENHEVMWIELLHRDWVNYEECLFFDSENNKIVRRELIPIIPEEEQKRRLKDYFYDDGYRNAYSYFYDHTEGRIGPNAAKDYAGGMIKSLKKNGKIRQLPVKKCVRQTSVGDYDVGVTTLPCERVNYIPFMNDLLGFPEGEGRHIDGVQEAFNQTLLLMLHNGRLLSNPMIFAMAGVLDQAKIAKIMGIPCGVIEWTPKDLSNPEQSRPVVVQNQAIGPHFADVMNILKNMAEYQTGISSSFQGSPQGVPDVHATVVSLDQRAAKKLIRKTDIIQNSLACMGEVMLDYFSEYSQSDAILRLDMKNDALMKSIVNSGAGTKNPDSFGHNVEISINQSKKVDGQDVVVNDIRNARKGYRVIVQAAPSSNTTRERWADDLRQFVQQVGDPQIAMSAYRMIGKLTEAPFIDELFEEVNFMKILQGQLDESQKTVEKLTNDLMRAEARTTTARTSEHVSTISAEASMKFGKVLNRFELIADKLNQKIAANSQASQQDVDKMLSESRQELGDFLKTLEEEQSQMAQASPQVQQQEMAQQVQEEPAPTNQ
jgi:hypothetical protein